MNELPDALRGRGGSWLLALASQDLKRRTNNGLPWPAYARAAVDALRADRSPPISEMSPSGTSPGNVVNVVGLIPVAEAAQHVARTPRYVRRLAANKQVIGLRVGRDWLVDLDSLRSVLANARRAS